MNINQKIYEEHHLKHRSQGFSILKNERGLFFKQQIGESKKVLDIGCRDGSLTQFFIEGNDVIGVDIDSISLERARSKGLNVKQMDIYGEWQELEGAKFDVIVAGEVLEHLFFPNKIIKKVSEYLSQGGVFIGSVPNAFSLKNRLRYLFGTKKNTPLSDPTHVNQFSRKDLFYVLKESFKDVKIYGLGRHAFLARFFPNLFAFDLVFVASNK